MIKNFKLSSGYTLIELLVVMSVMITVGFIVLSILVSSLRGTNKASTIETIRQNGNYTILQMSRMIEFAQSFGGLSSNGSSPYTITCPQTSPIPTYNYIKITNFDGGQTIFSCDLAGGKIASNGASFINTNDVGLSKCSFTCTRNNISQSPVVGINFTLTQKSSSSFFEKQATIPFSTSVVVRNPQ